jgi:ABC-type glycerol-3-phosphate transport system permease component
MDIFRKVVLYVILILLAMLFLAPIYGIATMSLKSLKELAHNYWGIPREPRWQNFDYVWNRPTMGLKPYFLNSLKITLPTIVVVILFSLLAAYPLAKFQIKGQRILIAILIFGITIPHQILIVPVFKMINALRLYDTIFGLMIVHIGYGLPFCTFLLRNYMVTIPKEMVDAAMVDGCTHRTTIFRIILPICKPVIAVIAILEFTWVFNEFFYGLVLANSINSAPVVVAVAFLNTTNYAAYWNYQAAAALIISIPTMIVFLFFQRFFIKGIMLGAIKG